MAAVSARVRAVSPLLAVEQSTEHAPTRELLAELRRKGWGVKWKQGVNAMLVHPRFGSLEVEAERDTTGQLTDRLLVYVDGRQVSRRMAMQRARGEI